MKRDVQQNAIVSQLFFRLLPIQALIVAMGSVNSIVDGVIAGRFIAPSSVGVIGLYYTMVRVLEAAGAHRLPSPSREWKLSGWDEQRAWV